MPTEGALIMMFTNKFKSMWKSIGKYRGIWNNHVRPISASTQNGSRNNHLRPISASTQMGSRMIILELFPGTCRDRSRMIILEVFAVGSGKFLGTCRGRSYDDKKIDFKLKLTYFVLLAKFTCRADHMIPYLGRFLKLGLLHLIHLSAMFLCAYNSCEPYDYKRNVASEAEGGADQDRPGSSQTRHSAGSGRLRLML